MVHLERQDLLLRRREQHDARRVHVRHGADVGSRLGDRQLRRHDPVEQHVHGLRVDRLDVIGLEEGVERGRDGGQNGNQCSNNNDRIHTFFVVKC